MNDSLLMLCKENPTYGTGGHTVIGIPESPTATKILYCVHGNVVGSCHLDDNDTRGASAYAEHCHQDVLPSSNEKARRKLILATVLCVLFMLGEAVGGYLSNSLAIATDAAHLLTDFASFMISLFALYMAKRPATRKLSFGWYRAEVIGALTSVILIWVVTGILVYMAVERIINEDFEIDPIVMLITAGVGVIVNLIMGLTLHEHGHTHGGSGSSHSHQNINVRAAFIHVVGDFIQSFGVLVAAIVIYFKPTWQLVDPICTFLFSVLVMATTFAIVKDALMVLMEGKPRGVDFEQVTETFKAIEGVVRVHNLRIWALSMDKVALSAHLAISADVNPQKILSTASKSIRSKYEFFEVTLQVEQFDENMVNCIACQMPEK